MTKPSIKIVYCWRCRFVLRASWLAQELLFTFEDSLGEVALRPGASGVFEVWVGEELIWSRADDGRFPDSKELKQRVRDLVDPGRHLGHSDAEV